MTQRIIAGLLAATFAVAAAVSPAQAAHEDPPTRVARLAYVTGDASFSPAGEQGWYRPVVNRPLYRGDRVWTDRRGRIELQVGGAAVRLDQYSSLRVLDIDDDFAQFELTEGTLNLGVHHLYEGQVYEIATPMLALVVSEPGSYRIHVDSRGATDVIVWRGRADAYGEGTSFPLRDGDGVTFFDRGLRDYQFYRLPRPDSFDRFVSARDERLLRSPSLRYVSTGMVGYADLDEYGSWRPVSDYGQVWFPRSVPSGWAPYRHGHWIWQEPWGWTWVDDMPWGYAPSHYGRWVQVGPRWGWTPGPRHHRPVYAPALVAFFSGSGLSVGISLGSRPVGWFPLGPRDVYVPGYRVSRDYFTQVNVRNTTIINNTYVNNVYNNYYVRDRDYSSLDYAYRGSRDAITAVPADVFTQGRQVSRAALSPARFDTARAEVRRLAPVTPVAQSLTGAETARVKPSREIERRQVMARRAPPAAPAALPGREAATDEVRRQVRVLDTPSRRVDRADVERVRAEAVARGQQRVPASEAADADERRSRGVPQRQDQDARARQAQPPARGRAEQARQPGSEDASVRAAQRQQQEAEQRGSRGRAAEAAAQRDAEQARAAQQRAAQDQARETREAEVRSREADVARQRAERAEQVERSNQREAAAHRENARAQQIAAERARAADRDREAAERTRAAERQRNEAAEAARAAERAGEVQQQQRREADARERQAEAARERAGRAEAVQRRQALERQQAGHRAAQAREQQQQAHQAQQRAAEAQQQEKAPQRPARGRGDSDETSEEQDEREQRGRGRERRR